jgi:hypothetical protein
MNNPEVHAELDWQAFRYVAGELDAAELATFEQLLAEDQSARDAVLRAVELTQTIFLAEQPQFATAKGSEVPAVQLPTLPLPSRPHFHWLGWATVAGVCLLLIGYTAQRSASHFHTQHVSPELAEAWGSQMEQAAAVGSDLPVLVEPSLFESSDSEFTFLNEPTPVWMLEAVRGFESSEEQADSTPEIMES